MKIALILLSFLYLTFVFSDIPVHCLYEDFYGEWTYSLGPAGGDNTIDCSSFSPKSSITINLAYPDVALDNAGHSGFWTRIYDEGAEVVLNGVKYFAFVKWNSTSYDCSQTMNGWYHNQDGTNWGCFKGQKNTQVAVKPPIPVLDEDEDFKFPIPESYHPILSQRTEKQQFVTKFDLPDNWDWRNVNGVNYVSPVRDQNQCGSCYAFGTLAMIESRIRIMTNNALQPVLSTQNIVSCSEYSQGCDGGFPYLVSKFGQDFQYYPEDCFPYTGHDSPCTPCDLSKTDLYHATGYYYVGGHYGGCSAEEMMFEVYINGPVAVSFEVYNDFYSYTGGVYIHNTTTKRMNEWEETNHAVCVVGWGIDEDSGVPFWTVKNSWGTSFGEDGYFRIRRNTDECAIESMAMSARPVLPSK